MRHQGEVLCKNCGAELIDTSCRYCGTEWNLVFMTRKELDEIVSKYIGRSFFMAAGLDQPYSYMGREIILKPEA